MRLLASLANTAGNIHTQSESATWPWLGFDSRNRGDMPGLSLLLVLVRAPRCFCWFSGFNFPSPQNPTFPNSNSIWIIIKHFAYLISVFFCLAGEERGGGGGVNPSQV